MYASLRNMRNIACDATSQTKLAARGWLESVRGAKPHSLSVPVVVSLTSYPARFPTLGLTLQSLLRQSIKPDATVLWIAHDDMDRLPADILALKDQGLTITTTADSRQYKKIIPALAAYPDALIVTADDDVYYWDSWLSDLLTAYRPGSNDVLLYRGYRIGLTPDGKPTPYNQWTSLRGPTDASGLHFPTGVAGVLYAPGTFAPEVLDLRKAQEICPHADDIWLYFMAGLAGARWRKIGPYHNPRPWRRSQASSLAQNNVIGGGNDAQFNAMLARYGASWLTP